MDARQGTEAAGIPSLRRYTTVMRRAAYRAEVIRPRRMGLGLGLGRAVRRFVSALAPKLRFARPLLRPFALVYWRVRHLARLAVFGITRALLTLAHANRRLIRRLMRHITPRGIGLTGVAPGLGLAALSQRLIERRIPVVSGLAHRLVYGVLTLALSGQIAAGHIGNTLALARIVNLAFRPAIRKRRLPVSFLYFQALFHARQYHRIIAEVPDEEVIANHYLNHILGVAHLYSSRPARARYYLERALTLNDQYPLDHRMLGRAHLMSGDETAAMRCFRASVTLAPETVMAHQNYAGRYDIPAYRPKAWELENAERLMLFDNYGQMAEDLFLIGRSAESFRFYQKMLDTRGKLAAPLPADLAERLAALDTRFDPDRPVRLLPYEWVTQFGHIGLLDSYMKMARLGMYPVANHVVLAPRDKVSNADYLACWNDLFTIVRDGDLVDELFPYQRMIGEGFMAYPGSGGMAEPWTRAAARAHVDWAAQRRAPLLRLGQEQRAEGEATLRALGIPEGAWYVGLHVREGGYYGESSGGMSTHRNAAIADHLPAIRAVTGRGGHVVRLGDASMTPLPALERVVDYAHAREKSAAADIFLCASSRFVIGTTSGLTTACLSFGTPMLLVNCISNDWQLWSDETHFIVKRVRDIRAGRVLPFAEVYGPRVQPLLINAQVMRRNGLEAIPNTPDEIAEAVRWKLDLLDGVATDVGEDALRTYRAAMAANPMMFGAGRPVAPFLARHPDLVMTPSRAWSATG